MPNELLKDIQFKARTGAQISVDKAEGVVECFVSGIGNKDSVGDIVLPGAFTESLKRRKPRVVWGHSWNDPIGKVLEIYEVPSSDPRLPQKMKSAGIGGLFAKVQFNLGAEKGREAFANVAFFGEEQEWSIGYKTLQATFDPVQQANMLKEVELYEVSPVLHGANQLTGTISVKDGEEGACGLNGCECGTKNLIASEPDIQTEEETSLIFEKGHMMGSMPIRMIILPMNKPSDDSDEDDASSRDIWSRGEAGPIDAEKRMELAKEIHSRTKVPIKIIEATENMVVFLRKMVDGTTRMYRMAYHHPAPGKYMFGKPARVKPQMMYAPVTPNMPASPMNMPASPMGPMVVKPNPIQGKETDEVKTDPFLIPCEIEEVFEVKESLEPILEYYDVKVTPSAGGLICTDYPFEFREAADTAVKALGRRLGRGGGLGKARRAGRALRVFDPKAWDGDNDGLVQEGTPWERPAIPGINTNRPGERHTRKKPKDYPDDDPTRYTPDGRTLTDDEHNLAYYTDLDPDGMTTDDLEGFIPDRDRYEAEGMRSSRYETLPSKAIRDMSAKEREGRIGDIRDKISVLDEELDLIVGKTSRFDPAVIDPESDRYIPEVAAMYSTPEELRQGLLRAVGKMSDLQSELFKHRQAAAIYSWEDGKQSFVHLSKGSKGIELELTPDEIDSLRSHIKAMVDSGENKKANGILAKYDTKLSANKKGVVKISPEEYREIVENWDKVSPPEKSRVHGKTGRDILEFAALSDSGKYRSPQLDLRDDKYRGFGSKRINNGAPPEITPAQQKLIITSIGREQVNTPVRHGGKPPEGPARIWATGMTQSMLNDLAERKSVSPRRWAFVEGKFTFQTSQGRQPANLSPTSSPGGSRRISELDPPAIEVPQAGRRADSSRRSANFGRGGRSRAEARSGPQSLRTRPKDRDALFDDPYDDPIDDYDMLPDNDPRARATLTRSAGMRSQRGRENAEDARETRDLSKPKGRGRPMGTVPEGIRGERDQGLSFEAVKPDNWDQLSTEDKFSLLNAELTPKRSGIAPIHYTRIYNELDKILERQEKRRNRSEGNFESLAERRARRGGINMPRSVAERDRKPQKEPQRRTASTAKTERKQNLSSLERAFSNSTDFIFKNDDKVGDDHKDIWDDAADILSESDDLTMSQLQALDSLFDSYLSGAQDTDLTTQEGDLFAAAIKQKNKIEDLLSYYEGDRFISQGDTAVVRRLGSNTPEGADIMESGDLPDLFSSEGLRSVRQNRGKLPGEATEAYVRSRRRQGMRSQRERSREGRISDLRNLWRNAEATGDSAEMDRLERQLRELNAGPPINRRTPKVGRARPHNRQNPGGNFRNTGERGGMRSERAGRAQISGEATWFKKIENSLDKEIQLARDDDDRRTVDALRTLQRTLSRQESGKTGDKRTNAGTLTVTQDEIDEMLDGLMNVLDRQIEIDGSRTEIFAELIEKLSSAAMSTFITRDTDEIQSRTREATNEAGRTVRIANTDL